MLSCSALVGLSFTLNFIFEFGMTRETWLLVLSSSKVLGDFPGDVQARQLRGNMRKRAWDETTSMQAIYDQEKVKLLQQSLTVKSSLYRERRKRFPQCHPQEVTLTWMASGQLWFKKIGSCLARMAMELTK